MLLYTPTDSNARNYRHSTPNIGFSFNEPLRGESESCFYSVGQRPLERNARPDLGRLLGSLAKDLFSEVVMNLGLVKEHFRISVL